MIDNQRPKLKELINNIEIEGGVDSGAAVCIISPKSWPPYRPLQEIEVQFQGVRTLSQILKVSDGLNVQGQNVK